MADYDINAVTRRVVYSGASGLGPYAFAFEILEQTDVVAYFNATKLTLTTDYTVTINSNGTGSVNIVTGGSVPSTPIASDQIVLVGSRDIERTTDFVTAGELRASALNEQLDSLTIFDQQLAEEQARTIRAPVYDPALVEDGGVVDMTLPAKADRAGKTLAFDSDGNPEAGPSVTEVANAATNASAAASSATAAASSAVSAANSAAAAAAAFDSFDDTYLGSFSSDPTTDNDGNPLVEGALYFNGPANEMRVYDGANWIAATSSGTATMRTYKYTATASQTTFSGSDDSGSTLSYSVNNLIVTLNGLVLENGSDYTATDGTSIVLTVAASVNDELNIIAFTSFAVGEVSVNSVNGQQGTVVLDADDISDASTTNKYTTAGDISKLAGIEAGATADQTPAEIKSAYESNADTNEFSDAEQSKLAGIETNATADQTAAEIKTAYESNADTNEFSDAEKSKLAGIEANATADQTAAEIRTLVDGATDSNVFTDADHSKLDGIAAGAEVNAVDSVNTQTGAVVLDADDISDASTTNKYTTAGDISKLAGIAAGAEVNTVDSVNTQTGAVVLDADDISDVTTTNKFTTAGDISKLAGIEAGAEVNLVDSVNTQTGAVVLDADDISDAATTNKFTTAGDISKLAGIEALADVTDATNVAAAGAAMLTGATFTGNVSFGDNNKAIFGAGSDLEIFHDGSNSIISDLGTGDLIIKGSNNIYLKDAYDEIVMRAGTAIGARLYYGNSSEKLRTTASGIFIYGNVEAQSGTVDGELIAKSYNETYDALSGTTPTVDCHNGNMFSLTTSGNTTFTFSNPPASGTAFGFTLKLVAGGTHTITYPASVDWAGGSAPDAPASGETDVLVFITHDGGTTWYGFRSGDAMA